MSIEPSSATETEPHSVLTRVQVYVHIGLHKTGTTSIQWWLTHARSQLSTLGYLYPLTGVPDWAKFGQHMLAWSLMRRESFLPVFNGRTPSFTEAGRQSFWSELLSQVESSGATRVVLSSEEFDCLDIAEIQAIGSQLSAFDIIPILYIRNHVDFVESAYRTSVVHSAYHGDAARFASSQRTRLDFVQMIGDWATIAKANKVVVLSYDDPDVRADSVRSFANAIGLQGSGIVALQRVAKNESVSAGICEIVRFLRAKGCSEDLVQEWVARVRPRANSHVSHEFSSLTSETRADLARQYEQERSAILADERIASMLGSALPVYQLSSSTTIDNVVVALLAIGKELAS